MSLLDVLSNAYPWIFFFIFFLLWFFIFVLLWFAIFFILWFAIFFVLRFVMFVVVHYLFVITNIPLIVLHCELYGLTKYLATHFLL